MSQIVDDLRQVAIEIKTETQVGGNTAARVGGAFERVADALEGTQQIEDMDAAVAAVQQAAQENEQTIQDIVDSLAVVQETGQSASDVMSQRAVTNALLNLGEKCVSSGTKSFTSADVTWGRYTSTNTFPVAENTRVMGIIPCEGYNYFKLSIGNAYKIAVAQFSIVVGDGQFSSLDQTYMINTTGWEQSVNLQLNASCKTLRVLVKNNAGNTITIENATSTMGEFSLLADIIVFSPAAPYEALEKANLFSEGYIRNAITPQSNISVFGTAISYQWSNGEIVITQLTSANGGIAFSDFPVNKSYIMQFKAKSSYDGQIIRVGDGSSIPSAIVADISLGTSYNTYLIDVGTLAMTTFSITILQANVHVNETITISDMVLFVKDGITENKREPFITFNTDAFLQSVSRNDKYLVKIACEGDSLIANAIGGAIPQDVDEGVKARPMRMETNNVPRRLYDYMSWNKPIWRRLDHSAWTKSGFSSVSNWNNQTNGNANAVFHGTNEVYHKATTNGAYCEITIPDGYEHFALVCRTRSGNGTLNVTINGSLPSNITYLNPVLTGNPEKTTSQLETLLNSNSLVNTSVCPINLPCGADAINLNKGTTACGNAYAMFEFNNLPSGNNVIRFTAASSQEVDVWGGFYWSGHTMVIMNIAHGGRTTSDLITYYLPDELYNADYDAVLFEVTEMNNTRLALDVTESDLLSIISKLEEMGIDHCFTSCNPLGLSIVHDVNFWSANTIATNQLTINNKVKDVMFALGQPFIDLFEYYRWHTENRGGTLEGGEAGLWYTWDGQHGNAAGVKLWFDALIKVIAHKSIMID